MSEVIRCDICGGGLSDTHDCVAICESRLAVMGVTQLTARQDMPRMMAANLRLAHQNKLLEREVATLRGAIIAFICPECNNKGEVLDPMAWHDSPENYVKCPWCAGLREALAARANSGDGKEDK